MNYGNHGNHSKLITVTMVTVNNPVTLGTENQVALQNPFLGEEERGFSLLNRYGDRIEGSNIEGLLTYNGGTVCDDGFNITAGHLICKEMGFGSAESWTSGIRCVVVPTESGITGP